MKAYKTFSTLKTSQREAIPGRTDQVKNHHGGMVFELDDMKAFERFLILGSEGGTYYVGERQLTKENALRVIKAIAHNGRAAVDLIVGVSDSGRAPKNDPAIFALAIAASAASPATRQYALAALPKVCRIPTHLFHFLTYVKQFRGFGRGLRTALAKWYNEQEVGKLAYEVVKYQQRDGWSNADVLRLAHPKTLDPARNGVYKWVVDGIEDVRKLGLPISSITAGFELAKDAPTKELVQLIKDYNLSREMLPTEALKSPEVWEALLDRMPFNALIRNLGNLSKVGLLKPLSYASKLVVEKLHNAEGIKKARLHPIAVLVALKTYKQGHGVLGKGEWSPVPAVVDALDDAFYLAFEQMEPTGKRLVIGLDVSGSMDAAIAGLPLTCAEAGAAMALACAKSESEYYIMGFSGDTKKGSWWVNKKSEFRDLGFTSRTRLDEALKVTRECTFGPTDCALPMVWATKNEIKADAFIVITDNETWAGNIQPSQALNEYRKKSGINAKQIVIGMTASKFTIADPTDFNCLDVVGFDTATPQAVQEFVR